MMFAKRNFLFSAVAQQPFVARSCHLRFRLYFISFEFFLFFVGCEHRKKALKSRRRKSLSNIRSRGTEHIFGLYTNPRRFRSHNHSIYSRRSVAQMCVFKAGRKLIFVMSRDANTITFAWGFARDASAKCFSF